jgi:hypothetical protein
MVWGIDLITTLQLDLAAEVPRVIYGVYDDLEASLRLSIPGRSQDRLHPAQSQLLPLIIHNRLR